MRDPKDYDFTKEILEQVEVENPILRLLQHEFTEEPALRDFDWEKIDGDSRKPEIDLRKFFETDADFERFMQTLAEIAHKLELKTGKKFDIGDGKNESYKDFSRRHRRRYFDSIFSPNETD